MFPKYSTASECLEGSDFEGTFKKTVLKLILLIVSYYLKEDRIECNRIVELHKESIDKLRKWGECEPKYREQYRKTLREQVENSLLIWENMCD